MNMLIWILDEILATGRRLNHTQKRQIYQSLLSVSSWGPRIDIEAMVPSSFLSECRASWLHKQKHGMVIPSMVEVFNALRRMGYKCEARMLDNVISASTAEGSEGTKIAIEIDTPIRCFRNLRNRRLGRYDFRQKVIEGCGWKVIRINMDEWVSLEGMSSRFEYLKEELSKREAHAM